MIPSQLWWPLTLTTYLLAFLFMSLCLPSRHFPIGFPTKILYSFLVSHILSTCPALHILLDFTINNNTVWPVQITKFIRLHPELLTYFILLRPKYFPVHSVFRHLQFNFSLTVRDHTKQLKLVYWTFWSLFWKVDIITFEVNNNRNLKNWFPS
jgi:hypothetical protein